MTVRFLHLHFKFTFTFTFSPLYNHRILPVTFVIVSAPIVPRCRRVIPLLALAVALCRGFIYKKIVASSLFLIIYE